MSTEEEVADRWLALCDGFGNDTSMTHHLPCMIKNGTFDLLMNKDNIAAETLVWT